MQGRLRRHSGIAVRTAMEGMVEQSEDNEASKEHK
jgi:hypothetical protein